LSQTPDFEQYLFITAEYSKGQITIFCRDSKYQKTIKKIVDFLPYFYVKEEETIPEDPNVLQVQHGFKSLFEDKLKKIIMKYPQNIGGGKVFDKGNIVFKQGFREKFTTHYEADIEFLKRFLIDTGIKKYFLAPTSENISWRQIIAKEPS